MLLKVGRVSEKQWSKLEVPMSAPPARRRGELLDGAHDSVASALLDLPDPTGARAMEETQATTLAQLRALGIK